MKRLTVLFCIIAVYGCGSSILGPNTKMIDMTNYKSSDDSALIYFIREHHWSQKAVKSSFYIDNNLVGTLTDEDDNFTYLVAEVPAGSYDITVKKHDMFGATIMTENDYFAKGTTFCYLVWKATVRYSKNCPDPKKGKFVGFMKYK